MKMKNLLVITIFKNVLKNEIIKLFTDFLACLQEGTNSEKTLKLYSDFIEKLYESEFNQNLYLLLKHLIYTDENIISKGCADCIQKDKEILETAKYELSIFDELLNYDYKKITEFLNKNFADDKDIIAHLPAYKTSGKIDFDIYDIINTYTSSGYGIFACYSAFKFNVNKEIIPVRQYNAMTFDELKNYEYQQDVIKKNTLAFLEGKPSNNILLYGDRGCGKSSTVKALINEFGNYNLKIIQITKESFIFLSDLYEKIRNLPSKFIIFADDISFDEDDKNFSSIKAVLEGSLSDRPQNAVIYATTNRMHLVKESFSSREGSELHLNDTIDELVSLSDRFGIMLTFSSLTKTEYLDIVKQIAQDCCINVDEKLFREAEMFAALKTIRTPRTARQFITDYLANL